MKSEHQRHHHLPLLFPILIVCFIVLILVFLSQHTPPQLPAKTTPSSLQNNQTTTYYSKSKKFTINVPNYFKITDEDMEITLEKGDSTISVTKNGTNFDNLSDYIKYFDSKRTVISSNTVFLTINGNKAISRIVEFPVQNTTQKSYYIYVDNSVFILSTSSPSLYRDLDSIARSFHYIAH